MSKTRMSARKAAWIGSLWVNGSVVAACLAVFALFRWILDQESLIDRIGLGFLVLIPAALIAPWLIWSVQVTRWRLWAYRRVSDLDALKAEAVALSVIWPSGHFFEKTEIRTRSQKRELERLERAPGSV